MLCSGHDGEGLNVKRDSFEAEGRKHWGGTFLLLMDAMSGFKVLCAVHCCPVLRPYCLNRQHSGGRGSTMLFSELEKPEHSGSDFFQHRNRYKAVWLGLRFSSILDICF